MRELTAYITDQLSECYDGEELRTVTRALCTELLGIDELTWYLRDRVTLTDAQWALLGSALRRLQGGEPLQYVLGTAPFAPLTAPLHVDGRVLIPRPETAALARHATDLHPHTAIDLGTGSGCLALALASTGCSTTACDVSDDALEVARDNARRLALPVTVIRCDLLDATTWPSLPNDVDLLVSNPPYIRRCEHAFMDDRVTGWEPSLALYVPDDDPLLFYRAIARLALTPVLRSGGHIAVEVHSAFAHDTATLFHLHGLHNIQVLPDLFGLDRYVIAQK